jgi:hypothetical protein
MTAPASGAVVSKTIAISAEAADGECRQHEHAAAAVVSRVATGPLT